MLKSPAPLHRNLRSLPARVILRPRRLQQRRQRQNLRRRPARNPVSRKPGFARAETIYSRLEAAYPDAKCSLDFKSPLHLLIATILSAQSTDKMVNTITPALFRKYKSAKNFAEAD